MKICFPVSRENDGQPYQATDDKSLQAMLAKLRSEPNGAWLVGANGLWHGGVHLSDRASAPYAKLTPDLLQQDKVMPLRCMAEGELVAYRLNKAYLEAPYFRDEQLKYSSTFALVKSEYKAQDETLLTFYSLYMHLAPVSDYPAYPRYRAIVQHTLNTHRFTTNNEEQYGIPSDVTERGERRDYDIPPTNGSLKHGDEFLVYQTADFFMTTIISTRYDKVRFGLAQKLEGGVVKDKKKFWVELDPHFVEQIGEAHPQMPVWMQAAVKKGAFDSVQTLMGDAVIRINAGDPIGHLGLFESPAARLPDRMSYYFTHIEVLSADDNLPDFVNNTKHLADGRKYVTCGLDQLLHSYDATHKTFTPLKVRTQQEIVLAKALTSPVKDKNGVSWYKVTQTGWVKQNGELVTEVDQHDLNKLGFRLLEEEATTDFSKLTAEECVKVLLRHLLAVAKQDRRIDHALVPVRYERILRKLDKDGDRQLNAQEVRLGLYNPEMINVVTRFIVKHSSEWYEDSQGGPWENFFTNVVKNRTANKFWRQYLDDQVWMKEVEPFSSGKPVWHMHPVVFLSQLSDKGQCACNRDITIEEMIQIAPETKKDILENYVAPLNQAFADFEVNSCIEKAHILAQLLHESGGLRITKEIHGENATYSPWYGRGLVQLTLKTNYEKYQKYIGEDVTSSSIARDKLLSPPHSILSAFWYFKVEKRIMNYCQNDDFNQVTLLVNGGFNGYKDRLEYLNRSIKSLGAEHRCVLRRDHMYPFDNSEIYETIRGSFAWALWHDPVSAKNGTGKDKGNALNGYQRLNTIIQTNDLTQRQNNSKYYGVLGKDLLIYSNDRISDLSKN
ncbi:hypothetical protein EAE91_22720 [Photorhabdus noenieputensis]|uniref:glycoside hydrolase family 19 protein n=1 Tax=Photorhabdus noenieputensis TaxID=1208607 RepID=UPI001BD61388|nr:hypothetical protein [Photorhabdus noenieputensis]MBS9439858.1 hypothetical protein [Photorhabdus noenieputensis]MCK3667399.1 hypothetical protein [Photorhabdus noenieputensis]